MFRWYQNAERCYVYMSDVSTGQASTNDDLSHWEKNFRNSRWFTRGWTLQELLAPASVQFFSKEQVLLGNKLSLKETIHNITGIAIKVLEGVSPRGFSVKERLSWAEKRSTKREEDAVYCLFGIFDIHMSLIYGEGQKKAFNRLRREIDEDSKDLATIVPQGSQDSQNHGSRASKIFEWLSAPDSSTNYQQALKQRQDDTCIWFLESQQYKEWMSESASFLWLHGIPGSGKTILTSTILQDTLHRCKDHPEKAVAYFYFDFNDSQKQRTESMLRTLIFQLSQQSIDLMKILDKLFSRHDNGRGQPSLESLLAVLQKVIRNFGEVYIVLDALDECSHRMEVIEAVETMAQWQLQNSHFIISSRTEREIEISLKEFIHPQNCILLQNAIVDEDIRQYVRQRLSEDKGLSKWSKDIKLRQEIEEVLLQGIQGMCVRWKAQWRINTDDRARFRWAVCQLNTLGNCRNRTSLRKSLETLPSTLNSTYDRILLGISEEDSTYARRVLQWLAFSPRPLSMEEIAEVVAIDIDRSPMFDKEEVLEDPMEALDICSSLIRTTTDVSNTTPGSAKQVVMLAHYSVKEYLLSDRSYTGQAARYSMKNTDSHGIMARACIGYLVQILQSDTVLDDILKRHKLARYSAEAWIYHAKCSKGQMADVYQDALRLLSANDTSYLNWIRIWHPEHHWNAPDLQMAPEDIARPLYYTALYGLKELVAALLDMGADINAEHQRSFYGNALQAASSLGHTETVDLLLARGADVNAISHFYGTALQGASRGGYERLAKTLIENGANVNIKGGAGTALGLAVAYAHVSVVKLLLDNGAHTGVTGHDKYTPLLIACNKGHFEIVKLLLEHGADITAADKEGFTPLNVASEKGHAEIVHLLIWYGADVYSKSKFGWSPLLSASHRGHVAVVKTLLEHGGDIAATNYHGLTSLMAAAGGGHGGVIQLLLEHREIKLNAMFEPGLDPTNTDIYAESAISKAALHGHNNVLDRLLAVPKVKSDFRDLYGRTILWWAAAGGYLETVSFLLKNYNCDPNVGDKCGRTPYMIAAKKGFNLLADYLFDKSIGDKVPMGVDIGSSLHILCDVCQVPIPSSEPHYHCQICAHGDFDICSGCKRLGVICMDEAHVLVKHQGPADNLVVLG